MEISLPLDKMSVEEKVQAMELLWDDLRNHSGNIASPAWHGDVLTERDNAVREGSEEIEDWETAKKNIKNRIS